MTKYLLNRLVQTVIVLAGVTVVIFVILHVIPGDPAALMVSDDAATAEDREAVRTALGLDRPLLVQYTSFVGGLVQGDLGTSLWQSEPVSTLISRALPLTIQLTLAALMIAILISVPIAVLSALKQNTIWDRMGTSLALMGMSMPSFWQGIMLILLFSVMVPIFPVSGVMDVQYTVDNITGLPLLDALLTANWGAAGSLVMHLVLPAITLGTGMAAGMTRVLRSSLLEIKHQDFIDALRARGVPERTVIRRMFRNALPTSVVILGMRLGGLLGGALVIETVFSYPGMGWLLVNSINQRDFPVVQSTVVVLTLVVIIANLLADIAHGLVDPRVQITGTKT